LSISEIKIEGNCGLIPLISMCDPQLCNDSQARCTTTIFLCSSFSVLCSPRLVLCLYSSPLLALALIHSCHHRLPLPSSFIIAITFAITTTSSHQHTNVRCQHTGIHTSPGSQPRVLESSRTWPLSLSLSLFAPGNIPELSMQAPFCITGAWSDTRWLMAMSYVAVHCLVIQASMRACA